MLKAIATLSRKISRDYNSTGYGITLEGEIPVNVGEPEIVLVKVLELFALAEEALAQEIDRDQGDDAIGRRDEEPPQRNGRDNGNPSTTSNNAPSTRPQNGDAITPKQVKFLMTLAQRQRLTSNQLESRIEQAIVRASDVNGLTKREAGQVIDALSQNGKNNGSHAEAGNWSPRSSFWHKASTAATSCLRRDPRSECAESQCPAGLIAKLLDHERDMQGMGGEQASSTKSTTCFTGIGWMNTWFGRYTTAKLATLFVKRLETCAFGAMQDVLDSAKVTGRLAIGSIHRDTFAVPSGQDCLRHIDLSRQ